MVISQRWKRYMKDVGESPPESAEPPNSRGEQASPVADAMDEGTEGEED